MKPVEKRELIERVQTVKTKMNILRIQIGHGDVDANRLMQDMTDSVDSLATVLDAVLANLPNA